MPMRLSLKRHSFMAYASSQDEWFGSGCAAELLAQQAEAPEHLAIAGDEEPCGAGRPMADPIAGRQGENVPGLPRDRLIADPARAPALDDRADGVARAAHRARRVGDL